MVVAHFIFLLDQAMLAALLPRIASWYQTLASANWISIAYLLTSTIVQPVCGKLCALFGQHTVYISLLFLFLTGQALCTISPTVLCFILARSLVGLGGAGVLATNYIIISDRVPLASRPSYMSVFSSIYAVSNVAGPIIGGLISRTFGWQWCFVSLFLLTVPTMLGINRTLGASPLSSVLPSSSGKPGANHHVCYDSCLDNKVSNMVPTSTSRTSLHVKLQRIDLPGIAAMSAFVVLFLLAINWGGNAYPWNSMPIVLCCAGSVFSLLLFVGIELLWASEPLIPLSIFRNSTINLILITLLPVGAALVGISFYVPLYLAVVFGYGTTRVGLQLLPFIWSFSLVSLGAGAVASRFGLQRWYLGLAMTVLALEFS